MVGWRQLVRLGWLTRLVGSVRLVRLVRLGWLVRLDLVVWLVWFVRLVRLVRLVTGRLRHKIVGEASGSTVGRVTGSRPGALDARSLAKLAATRWDGRVVVTGYFTL